MVDSHDMAAYMAERRRNRREKLVELLGGVCVRCDADKALDFDHIIPGSQSFRISGKALDKPWEQLLAEVKKCQLLCRPCHRIKSKECGETGGGHNRIDDHATEAMYMKGCHCDPCRQARHDARVRRGDLKGSPADKKYKGLGRYGTITKHGAGTSGIKGCKCTICMATRAKYSRDLRRKK